jgi:hypothetical protein
VKARRQRKGGKGTLVFLAPFLVLVGILVYLYLGSIQPGRLLVRAQSSQGPPSLDLGAHVKVNGVEGTTPENLTLPQGVYNVTFLPLRWYHTPLQRTVSLPAGRTEYAVGQYSLGKVTFVFGANGFNGSGGLALHNLTPVVWVNTANSFVKLESNAFDTRVIQPGQNITYVFPVPGTYRFDIFSTQYNGNITVI